MSTIAQLPRQPRQSRSRELVARVAGASARGTEVRVPVVLSYQRAAPVAYATMSAVEALRLAQQLVQAAAVVLERAV